MNKNELTPDQIEKNRKDLLEKQTILQKRMDDLQLEQKKLFEDQNDLSTKQKQFAIAQQELEKQKIEAIDGFPLLFQEKFNIVIKELQQQQESYLTNFQQLSIEKAKLLESEQNLKKELVSRDAGWTLERKNVEAELDELRNIFSQEISDLRIKRNNELNIEIEKERKAAYSRIESELTQQRESLNQEINSLSKQSATHAMNQGKYQADIAELHREKARVEQEKEYLSKRSQLLDDEVNEAISERHKSFNQDAVRLKTENERLRYELDCAKNEFNVYEHVKRILQENMKNPEDVIELIKLKTDEIKTLHKKLSNAPSEESMQDYEFYKEEVQKLKQKNQNLNEENLKYQTRHKEISQLESQISDLEDAKKFVENRNTSLQTEYNQIKTHLDRINATYEKSTEREGRINVIEAPYINLANAKKARWPEKTDESQWLIDLDKAIKDEGFHFPRRLLHAFHTSLKTAEMSPITVLAGVSGTGKSQLPELYSRFGGLNFLNLPVQPNWDSQESMLGFFNSIDNKFDAQPVLQFLVQTQKPGTADYPGMDDVMNLILLDEMNLAHVELYFAEFLSQFESRRGKTKKDIPDIKIKLGAGDAPYCLPLGRNVLWAGTMNQDETTKSLSDKVLDRGIIINFPRPTKLRRRENLIASTKNKDSKLLLKSTWNDWLSFESKFTNDQIKDYIQIIENINNSMATVGRALGHRVWQSIEYYMSNYPDVKTAQALKNDKDLNRAMQMAFEDQLVQKVMPKLRGIETRGSAKTKCLTKIREELLEHEFKIIADFDHACEIGYGQFMWSSADYLRENENEEPTKNA